MEFGSGHFTAAKDYPHKFVDTATKMNSIIFILITLTSALAAEVSSNTIAFDASCWTEIYDKSCYDLSIGLNKVGQACLNIFRKIGETSHLLIEYEISNSTDFSMSSVHAWVGDTVKEAPIRKNGLPSIRDFPANAFFRGKNKSVQTYTLALDLKSNCVPKLDMLTRVALSDGSKRAAAWSTGEAFGASSKITYSSIKEIACACASVKPAFISREVDEPVTTTIQAVQEEMAGPMVHPTPPTEAINENENTATTTKVQEEAVDDFEYDGPMIHPPAPPLPLSTTTIPASTESSSTTQSSPSRLATTAHSVTEGPIILKDDGSCRRAFALCETGEGEAPVCFSEISWKFKKLEHWGWTQQMVEPQLKCNLWVGALNCDTSNASKVGTATISTKEFQLDVQEGYDVSNVHFYRGTSQLPSDQRGKITVAPKFYGTHYPIGEGTTWKIAENELSTSAESAPQWVILHATVCKSEKSR